LAVLFIDFRIPRAAAHPFNQLRGDAIPLDRQRVIGVGIRPARNLIASKSPFSVLVSTFLRRTSTT
jgi:hypothetical protein